MRTTFIIICNILLSLILSTVSASEKPQENQPLTQAWQDDLRQLGAEGGRFLTIETDKKNYHKGEQLSLTISSKVNAFVYVFNVTPQGRVHLLAPNTHDNRNVRINAQTPLHIPSPDGEFDLIIGGSYGKELLIALATTQPIDFEKTEEQVAFAQFISEIRQGMVRENHLVMLKTVLVQPKKQLPKDCWGLAIAEITTQEAATTSK